MTSLTIPALEPEWDTLRCALAYAQAGWYIIPVAEDTKAPTVLGKRWPSKSSRDPEEIISWFAGTNHALGLHVGRSGAIVIDVDNYDAEDFPIDAKMALDIAPFQSTRDNDPRRGHYVFAVPPGRRLGNSRGGLGKGFGEMRGTNGIIVVQPSRHVKDHGRYEWIRTGEVPVLPDEIGALLPEGEESGDAASDAEVQAFLTKHSAEEKPTLLKAVMEKFVTEMNGGGGRHEALVKHAAWAMREAASGFFKAQDAYDALWTDFDAAMRSERDRFPRSEFRGVMAWAIAQASRVDPEKRKKEVHARLNEAEPLPAVAQTAPVGVGAPEAVKDDWVHPRPNGPRDYFTDKEAGLDVALLADDVIDMGLLAWGRDSAFWSYADGVWSPDGDAVQSRCVRLLGGRFRDAHARNVSIVVRHSIGRIDCDPTEAYINFTNGMLEWRTGVLHPHAPHYGSTVQLPLEWNSNADCPEFDKFLDGILSPDYARLAWEMVGYLMMSGNPLQVAFLLLGTGQNGKGTLMRVVQDLLGNKNTSTLSLDALSNRFAPIGLFGKIANLAGDIDATYQESTAMFKMLTGEDEFRGEQKFVQAPFYFRNWAVPVFSANRIPGSADTSHGYLRRWKVIEFDRTISNAERIPGLSNRLSAELPGIAAKAVQHLRELMERNSNKGEFHTSMDIEHGEQRFAESIDQVRQWVNECCMPAPDTKAPWTDFYSSYRFWAEQNHVGTLKASEVKERLAGMGYPTKRIKGTPYTRGLLVLRSKTVGEEPSAVEDVKDMFT